MTPRTFLWILLFAPLTYLALYGAILLLAWALS